MKNIRTNTWICNYFLQFSTIPLKFICPSSLLHPLCVAIYRTRCKYNLLLRGKKQAVLTNRREQVPWCAMMVVFQTSVEILRTPCLPCLLSTSVSIFLATVLRWMRHPLSATCYIRTLVRIRAPNLLFELKTLFIRKVIFQFVVK